MDIIATIAVMEARQLLRGRWLAAYAACLALLGGAVSLVSLQLMSSAGFTGFERTATGLISLMLFVVPLAALLTTVPAFSDNQGIYRQLLCEPPGRGQLVAGKILGLVLGNGLAILIGFGLCAVPVGWHAGLPGLGVMAVITMLAILTAAVYISIGALLTIATGRGIRAYIAVLVVLIVSAVLFDIAMLALGLALPTGQANRLAFIGLFINPADAVRVAGMLAVGGKESLGVAAVLLTRSLGGESQAIWLLLLDLLGWVFVPAAAASWLLKRQDA